MKRKNQDQSSSGRTQFPSGGLEDTAPGECGALVRARAPAGRPTCVVNDRSSGKGVVGTAPIESCFWQQGVFISAKVGLFNRTINQLRGLSKIWGRAARQLSTWKPVQYFNLVTGWQSHPQLMFVALILLATMTVQTRRNILIQHRLLANETDFLFSDAHFVDLSLQGSCQHNPFACLPSVQFNRYLNWSEAEDATSYSRCVAWAHGVFESDRVLNSNGLCRCRYRCRSHDLVRKMEQSAFNGAFRVTTLKKQMGKFFQLASRNL